jgi:hypothetical protein
MAAVGFDKSFRNSLRDGGPIDFSCFPNGDAFIGHVDGVGGPTRATLRRSGDAWVAIVSYTRFPGVEERYRVERRDGGYCVSRVLGEVAGPPPTK